MLLFNRIFSNNIGIWIFSLLIITSAVSISIFSKKKNKILETVFCFVPLVLCIFHFIFFRIKGNPYSTKYYYLIMYIAGINTAFLPLISLRSKLYKVFLPIITTFTVMAGLHTIFRPMIYDSAMRNHSYENWTDSFISTTKDMEKYYSLKDWKQIDIPALRDKFLPVIQEAERTHDEGLFAAAVWAFSFYFYDGHVGAYINPEPAWYRALELLSGNDYGLSMAKLNDGTVVAVHVEDGSVANLEGIKNGTQIISWNGQEINIAIEETDFVYYRRTIPVKTTEDMLRPFMLATKGMSENGEKGIVNDLLQNAKIKYNSQRPKALVGFIDENGNRKEILLDALGWGIDRLELGFVLLFWKRFDAYPELGNLQTIMINDDTAYMKRYAEQSNVFFDVLSYFTSRAPNVRKLLKKQLEDCRNQGMKNLIIDARSNTGGFWALGVETASLFSTESFDIAKRGSEIFGKQKILQTVTVPADGTFSDINVILLVDPYCVSAGDSLVKMLSQCPNVTVMGLAPSNCSCQETGGVSFLSNSICSIVYPVNWLYEIDGRRYIDVDKSRECTLPLDVQIPLTYELLESLYKNWETSDVLLDYVIEYLHDD